MSCSIICFSLTILLRLHGNHARGHVIIADIWIFLPSIVVILQTQCQSFDKIVVSHVVTNASSKSSHNSYNYPSVVCRPTHFHMQWFICWRKQYQVINNSWVIRNVTRFNSEITTSTHTAKNEINCHGFKLQPVLFTLHGTNATKGSRDYNKLSTIIRQWLLCKWATVRWLAVS